MLSIRRETLDQPDVHALLAQADEHSAALYPEGSRHGLDVFALLALKARFFVARQDGRALGCGGYVRLVDGAAELKRLFIDPNARARGVGKGIVQAIECAAFEEGAGALRLETGRKSFEAWHLCGRAGFVECGPFAPYRPDPLSVFMVKALGDAQSLVPARRA